MYQWAVEQKRSGLQMTVSTNFTIWGFMWTLSPTLQCSFEFSGWSNGQIATLSVSGQEQGMGNLGAVKKTLTGSRFRHGLQLSPKWLLWIRGQNGLVCNMHYKNWIWMHSMSACISYTPLQMMYQSSFFLIAGGFFFPIPNCTVDYFKQY